MPTRTKGLVSPCYQCDDRRIGCHAKCSKYQEYSAEIVRRTKIDKEKSQGYVEWKQRRRR